MIRLWARRNGFTIVELLVVITVVAILAGIVIVSYGGIQERARDSERDSHITQIKVALDRYYAENSTYPSACSADNIGCPIGNLEVPLAEYLPNLPHDPEAVVNSAEDYQYVRGSALNGYGIRVGYEARAICKTGVRMTANWWSSAPTC